MSQKQKEKQEAEAHYFRRVKPEIAGAPWVLRVTEHKGKSVPIFIVKERILPDQRTDTEELVAPRSVLRDRGLLYGQQQLRCLPVIRTILQRVCDQAGIPLELNRFFSKLQERIKEMDRPHFQIRGRCQPLGHGRIESHAGGSSQRSQY